MRTVLVFRETVREDLRMLQLRLERPGDIAGVRYVNEQAFGRRGEADLVDALRASGALTISWVAVE